MTSTTEQTAPPPDRSMSRAFAFPEPGDNLRSFCERHFPGDGEAMEHLLSWNLHLVMRRSLTGAPNPTNKNPDLLPTDIVYVEAPRPNG